MSDTLLNGPWEQAFYVDLPAQLRSKSNYRRGKKGWGALATFEAVTASVLQQYRPEGWDLGEANAPVKERPTVVIAVAATSMLDSSNFTKSLADAMEGVLVHNDASIAANASISLRAKNDQRCGVAMAQLSAGATLTEQSEALQRLLAQLPTLFEG